MKKENRKKGGLGEDIAESYLAKIGYKILYKNWSNKFGELDLVVSNNNSLIFVEVKLKVGDDFGSPEEMINRLKLAKIQKTSEMFLQNYSELSKKYDSYQIDAVCIVVDKDNVISRINHYENISF